MSMNTILPKLSIIIPCYNGEKYIRNCLDKVLSINLNKEVIVINDGSTDNSLLELKKYGKKIILINLGENTGVSNARNVGIEKSSGEYVSFIDVDDTFEPNMHETLLKSIINEKADLSMCNNDFIEINNVRIKPRCSNSFNGLPKNEILKKYLIGEIYPAVWASVFSSYIIKKIKFNSKLKIGEDILFMLRCLIKSKKIVFNSSPLYHYSQNDMSIMHSASNHTILNYLQIPDLLSENEKNYILEKAPEEFEYFKISMIHRAINTISLSTNHNNLSASINIINKSFNKYDFKRVISNKYTPKHIKLEFFILKNIGTKFHLKMFPLYKKIRSIKRKNNT